MNKTDIIALGMIEGIGNKSLFNLITSGYEINDLVSMDDEGLAKFIKGSKKKIGIKILQDNYQEQQEAADTFLDDLSDNGIEISIFGDPNYPDLYKLIQNPPIILYSRGELSLLKGLDNIAIVGSRQCTEQGREVALRTASHFADKGFNIVSGLALGIDTAAHEGALKVNGRTTAILVNVDEIYPEENKLLAEEIVDQGGLLVSENAPGTPAIGGMFVARDRLQSGLSLGVFPIETNVTGGTMHTVKFAEAQNRLLFCPDFNAHKNYPMDNPVSQGVKMLISEKRAEKYTRKEYGTILEKLNSKKSELFPEDGVASKDKDPLIEKGFLDDLDF